jgi:hypothetical protein
MDPYLEDADLWPGLHQRFITYLADALSELLPPRYVANLNERLYIDDPNRVIVPDAAVFERSSPGGRPWGNPDSAGAAVLDPPWLVDWPAEEIREGFVEILPAREPDRVVAVIELLSPPNKAAGSTGRNSYRTSRPRCSGAPPTSSRSTCSGTGNTRSPSPGISSPVEDGMTL